MPNDQENLLALIDSVPAAGALIVVSNIHARELVKDQLLKRKGGRTLRFSKIVISTTTDSVRASIAPEKKLPILIDNAWWKFVPKEVADYLTELTGIPRPEGVAAPAAPAAPKPPGPVVRPSEDAQKDEPRRGGIFGGNKEKQQGD